MDIGSFCVKAVQLRHDEDGYKVLSAQRVPIAQDSSDDRTMAQDIIMAIRTCVKSAQIKTKYAVCGVCGPDVAARRFKFPVLQPEEVVNAVLFEAEQVCPFDRGKFIVDYQVIHKSVAGPENSNGSKEERKTQGVLVAATTNVIGYKSQLVRAANLNCVLMDVDGLALLNCFTESQALGAGQTVVILDVGEKIANLVILSDKSLPFVRDIAHFTDKSAKRSQTDPQSSLQSTQNTGGTMQAQGDAGRQSRENLEEKAAKVITGVIDTLRYYEVQKGNQVDRILLCGGLAQTDGFIELLDAQLSPEIVIWNPFEEIPSEAGASGMEVIELYGPSMALAAGLAMRII